MADEKSRNDDLRRRAREERLAAQLRANLARRKAQARARRDGEPDQREDGLPAAQDQENRG